LKTSEKKSTKDPSTGKTNPMKTNSNQSLVYKFARVYLLDSSGINIEDLDEEDKVEELAAAEVAIANILSNTSVSRDEINDTLDAVLSKHIGLDALEKGWG
jgi:glycine cleavage system regulatory protein